MGPTPTNPTHVTATASGVPLTKLLSDDKVGCPQRSQRSSIQMWKIGSLEVTRLDVSQCPTNLLCLCVNQLPRQQLILRWSRFLYIS
jgi:hypothetical protein